MADRKSVTPVYAPQYNGPRLLGAPVGDFSVLQTLLITVATGLASFFAATFLGIMTILVLTEATSRKIDFAIAYKWVGLPFGLLMLVLAAGYLGWLLLLRIKQKSIR